MSLADAYRSDGVAALLLSVPTAVFSAMAKIPGLTRDLNAVAFAISVGLLLLVTPVLIYALLRYIFALPTVGPARKTLSYTLVLLLWWALPLLGSVILALIWTVLGFLVMVFIVLLPLVATIAGLYYLLTGVEDSIQDQRRRFAEMGAEVEDITFVELGFALVAATVAACTVAPLVVLLALLKFPLVFLGVMLKVGHNVGSILGEMVKNAPWSCVCVLPFFLVAMAFMLLLAVLMLPISLVVKFVVAIYWPAYVACGWLRTVGSRRQHRDCGTILLETAKAAYQVLWFSDIITNAAVLMRFDLAAAARDQFVALAKGERTSLSAEVQAVSWMPPVVIGVLDQQRGTWRVELQRIARAINVPVDTLGKAPAACAEGARDWPETRPPHPRPGPVGPQAPTVCLAMVARHRRRGTASSRSSRPSARAASTASCSRPSTSPNTRRLCSSACQAWCCCSWSCARPRARTCSASPTARALTAARSPERRLPTRRGRG